ncbi:hypothetical protein L9F63_015473, partial [Diploptera punctata]
FTPAISLMILLQATLLGRFGSGPFWKSGTSHLSNVCRENWWSGLFYIQNFMSLNKAVSSININGNY